MPLRKAGYNPKSCTIKTNLCNVAFTWNLTVNSSSFPQVALTAPRLQDEPPLVLSPAQYYNYTQPTGNHIPYLNQAPGYIKPVWNQDATPEDIVQTFRLPSGVGATCCLKTPYNSSFDAAILKQLNFTYRYLFFGCIFPKNYFKKAQLVSTSIM